jgi:hypothetical protein
MVRMNTFEKEEYQELLEIIRDREKDLLELDSERSKTEYIERKREELQKEILDLLEEKRSFEMEKVPLQTKFTIEELKEFVWEGSNIGYTFRGKQVRDEVCRLDETGVDCYSPKYKIVDTPYHIEYLMGDGWSVLGNRGRFIARFNDFLYPEEMPEEELQDTTTPIAPSVPNIDVDMRDHSEFNKIPVKQATTFICWACDELLPISQRKGDGTCGDCL